ncbi:MAG: N-acetyl-gamma-glutamyl-phosphate reductase, partial [Candidatus Thioglobus sp.]|nr:N-acetyl-gamma-glutamyl-phosphate reductase [Candidatus Thioglobus sp.]
MMIKAGIIGGTGYTGVELLRLLHNHSEVEVVAISSRSLDGKRVDGVFPSLVGHSDLVFSLPSDTILNTCDVIFFATPHGVAMEGAGAFIDKGIKVIDLGADFRITDQTEWSKWYGMEHTQATLLDSAVYGLPETNRDQVKEAMLLANPGCYPTAVQLALKPLITNKLISLTGIVADCKSGVSGAGRGANQAMLLCEASESLKSYGVSGHRHYPEIKQELEILANEEVNFTFVPHLVPMIRGMQATIYVDLLDENIDVRPYFVDTYSEEPFVKILTDGVYPETRSVKSSNFCQISIQKIPNSNKLVIMSVIDNLVKGASGQAVQNMNIMFGLDETSGLTSIGLL